MLKKLSYALIGLSLMPMAIFANPIQNNGIYLVDNITVHDNPIGVAMSRSYMGDVTGIKKTSKEIIAYLDFNHTHYMGDFTIKINGEVVPYYMHEDDTENNLQTIYFNMNNLDDEILVGMFVEPMGINVEFGVELLQDTLVYHMAIVEDENTYKEVNPMPVIGGLLLASAVIGSMALKQGGNDEKIS
ncbi:MAG: hypothetical protein ATN36_05985 [Epulopiscium sp. Nele67-Bin005]|nr:MAG: hypothetical protein ATN36_05985 [Epulopiscium sp. Nele67-Bin005]